MARQARFLVLVLEHSGVCLPRQYRTFAGIAHGRHTHGFFETLIAGGSATTDLAAPAHAGRICHLQYKPQYRLLGAPDHPHRRAMSIGRAVRRQHGSAGADCQSVASVTRQPRAARGHRHASPGAASRVPCPLCRQTPFPIEGTSTPCATWGATELICLW